MFIVVTVFFVRVVEFLCTRLVPVLSMCRVILADTGSPARIGISILMCLGITGIFELGWIIPHPSLVILPWPTPIIYREGTGGIITWLPVQIDRAVRPPHIRVQWERRGCVNRGASWWLEFLLWNLCGGGRWRSRLKQCATSRKVAGSIPDGVGIFHWNNPTGRTMALGSTQPLTDMSQVKT